MSLCFIKKITNRFIMIDLSFLYKRKFFCLIPVFVGWALALYYRAMYQTSDDMNMRILLEGSIGGQDTNPSEFSLYMSVLYGKFLKFFYTIYKNGFWYDIFTYLFCSIAIYVITFALFRNFEKETLISKILKVFIVSFVAATPFISPQFTLTSGMLAISGVLAFYMLATDFFDKKFFQFILCFYVFLSLLFSSLIRLECCLIVGFFAGVLMLPLLPYRNFKKLLKKLFVVVITLFIIVVGHVYNNMLVKHNFLWNETVNFNQARVELTDKTNMWDNLSSPWKDVINDVDKLNKAGFKFTPADYQILMVNGFFTDKQTFSSNSLTKISNQLSNQVQRFNSIFSGFRVKDFRNTLPFFIVLALGCGVLFFNSWKYILYCCLSFVCLIVLLNIEFRALPYRLWYLFALLVVVFIIVCVKLNIDFWNQTFYKKVCCVFIASICLFSSFKISDNQGVSTNYQYNAFRDIRAGYKSLDKDKLYLLSYVFLEHVCAPFSKNICFNGVTLSPFVNLELENKNIKHLLNNQPLTWEYICSKESKVRLLYSDKEYFGGFHALKIAITNYMLEKYKKHVVFIYQKNNNGLYTAQCLALTDDEWQLRLEYRKFLEGKEFLSNEYCNYYMYEFIRKVKGDKASSKEILDCVKILTAENMSE